MKAHKNIALFCGSSEGRDSRYSEAAQEMGMLLHERGYGMVYGGGNRGLMGIAAQSLHERGGVSSECYPSYSTAVMCVSSALRNS